MVVRCNSSWRVNPALDLCKQDSCSPSLPRMSLWLAKRRGWMWLWNSSHIFLYQKGSEQLSIMNVRIWPRVPPEGKRKKSGSKKLDGFLLLLASTLSPEADVVVPLKSTGLHWYWLVFRSEIVVFDSVCSLLIWQVEPENLGHKRWGGHTKTCSTCTVHSKLL